MIKNNFILIINKKNLLKNYNFFKKLKTNLIVAPAIKANAYGIGDKKIFKLLKNEGCKHFFVATLEEGINLNNKKNNANVYVLNGIQNYSIDQFKKNKLIPIVNSYNEFKKITKKNIKFGLHIDTGLNRLGINHEKISKSIFNSKNISLVLSHLSSADKKNNTYNSLQRNIFLNLIKKFKSKNIIFTLANSNGSILNKNYLLDMIRPGIGLYGGYNKNKILGKKIYPVIILKGKIIKIKTIKKNEFVGYNQTYKTKKITKIAIIGAGYADGVPRMLSNKGKVYYKDNIFKIIGRISMDSFTIDISNSKYNLKIGNFIDLINEKHTIEDFAIQSKTISNEVITKIGSRAKIIYV